MQSAARIRSYVLTHGPRATLMAAVRTSLHRIVGYSRRIVWEVDLQTDRPPSAWPRGLHLLILGSSNLDRLISSELRSFLGGSSAEDEIEGVRRGDWLFVLTNGSGYVARSFIFLDTTKQTRRQVRILHELPGTPVIGQSFIEPSWRGAGLYCKLLNEMFRFLSRQGYPRAVCEVHPRNTPSNRASHSAGMTVARELRDWLFLKRMLVQKSRQHNATRWRVRWI